MKKIWPWGIAAAVFAADRVTKILAPRIPAEGQVLIPGVLGLRYAENKGIAFSLLSGMPWVPGLMSLAIRIAGCSKVTKLQSRTTPKSTTATSTSTCPKPKVH